MWLLECSWLLSSLLDNHHNWFQIKYIISDQVALSLANHICVICAYANGVGVGYRYIVKLLKPGWYIVKLLKGNISLFRCFLDFHSQSPDQSSLFLDNPILLINPPTYFCITQYYIYFLSFSRQSVNLLFNKSPYSFPMNLFLSTRLPLSSVINPLRGTTSKYVG